MYKSVSLYLEFKFLKSHLTYLTFALDQYLDTIHFVSIAIDHFCLYNGSKLLQKFDDLEQDALLNGVKKPQRGLKRFVLSNLFQASSSPIWA